MNGVPPQPGAHERYRDDLAAYALGALADDETARLGRHLEGCEECRAHLRWLQPAVDLLPRSVEQVAPPPQLRKRLMATVRAELPDAADVGAAGSARRRWRGWLPTLSRPAIAVAAAVLLAAGVVGGYLLHQPGESNQVIAAKPSPTAPQVAATLERQDGSAILRMTSLPPLAGRGVYEVWVQRGSALEPASLFVPRRDRTAAAAVPGPLDGADAVLVTREPHGGSRHPTTPPLLSVQLH